MEQLGYGFADPCFEGRVMLSPLYVGIKAIRLALVILLIRDIARVLYNIEVKIHGNTGASKARA